MKNGRIMKFFRHVLRSASVFLSAKLLAASAGLASAQPQLNDYASVVASDPGSNFAFGTDVAASCDTIVVGSRLSDSNSLVSGSATVLVRRGNLWTEQAVLLSNEPDVDDLFGRSVAISGDTIAVGAFGGGVGSSETRPGAVHVFQRNGDDWVRQARFNAPSSGAGGDEFGRQIALDGNRLVVGAPGLNDERGQAFVFDRFGDDWIPSHPPQKRGRRLVSSCYGPRGER